jgi:hypothetical protein
MLFTLGLVCMLSEYYYGQVTCWVHSSVSQIVASPETDTQISRTGYTWYISFMDRIHWLIDWLTLDLSPYGPDAPRPYRQALCAPKSYINSGGLCSFIQVLGGPQIWNLNVLWVQEWIPDILFLFSQLSPQMNPLQVPMVRDTCLQGICISLENLIKIPLNKNARRQVYLHVPQKWGPYGSRAHFRALLNISFGVPIKGAFPHGIPCREMPCP